MSNNTGIVTSNARLSKIVGDKSIRLGWNEARGGQWSDNRGHRDQLRYEAGRYMYTIARTRTLEGNAWAPPRCVSGKALIRDMGVDVVSHLYRTALEELGL